MRTGQHSSLTLTVMMISSQETPVSPVVREAVLSWTREQDCPPPAHLRAPVLPDLRSGAGFTLVVWLHLDHLGGKNSLARPLLMVDGMSRVSGSLGDILTKYDN